MKRLSRFQPNSTILIFLLLSILLHFLFFLGVSVGWVFPPIQEIPPGLEVPAYFYQDKGKSGSASEAPPSSSTQPKEEPVVSKQYEEKTQAITQPKPSKVSSSAASPSDAIKVITEEEPIHLVGDKHTPPKPLAKIIGRALTKKLHYPKIAVDFRVRGTAFVGFSIHPDGSLTGIKLVQSSRAGVLDEAALAAVRAITPLQNVAAYVSKPRYLVIGIIFR